MILYTQGESSLPLCSRWMSNNNQAKCVKIPLDLRFLYIKTTFLKCPPDAPRVPRGARGARGDGSF